jgi:ubiquitin carboxyl-terminal hydrolase 9/13
MCDDENVEPIEEEDLANYFGDNITGAGYVLFYQAVNLDLMSLGLKKMPEPRVAPWFPTVTMDEVDKAVDVSSPTPTASTVPITPIIDGPVVGKQPTAGSKTDSNGSSRVATPPNGSSLHDSVSTKPSTPGASAMLSPTAQRREASAPGYFKRDASTSRSPGQEKTKWFSLKKSPSVSSSPDLPVVGMKRQSTATTVTTVSTLPDEPGTNANASANANSAQTPDFNTPARRYSPSPIRAMPALSDGHAQDLSASLLSTSTSSSSSLGVPAGPVPIARTAATPGGSTAPSSFHSASAHPSRSKSVSRPDRVHSISRPDRTASGTHMGNSAGSAGSPNTSSSYGGGSNLGRKLSGAAGFGKFKMGFGKKHRADE